MRLRGQAFNGSNHAATDKSETMTFNQPMVETYKVECFTHDKAIQHRLLAVDRQLIGTVEVEAESIEDAERRARKSWPNAEYVRVYTREDYATLSGWKWLCSMTAGRGL